MILGLIAGGWLDDGMAAVEDRRLDGAGLA